MSNRRLRPVYALVLISLSFSTGCWEQWSASWFPQMKRQPTVQAFESVEHAGRIEAFSPPEGAVPVGGGAPVVGQLDPWMVRPKDPNAVPGNDEAANALVNPRVPPTLASLQNGQKQYTVLCATCHGATGMADGPVAKVYGGVLPMAVAAARSDGHIYATIRYGRRRMPPYARISEQDTWDIINYVRVLNKGGRP